MKNISFIINTSVNTKKYVELLLKSLKDNLKNKEHEILVFVDSDNEGTADYLRSVKKDFYDLKIITHKLKPCVGYSRNNNLLVELAKHDIVSYLQSDMVISKNYDEDILSELEDDCILSSTRIEPPLHGTSDKTVTMDFGLTPQTFMYENFLGFAETVKQDKTLNYFFAPFTFHKSTWLKYGGYDTQFRRSREDSDLLQRFIQSGVKIKQTFKAIVYHFSCVSSRGPKWYDSQDESVQQRNRLQQMADIEELIRFIRKWGGFNHGESELKKYDIDVVINNISKEYNPNGLFNLEPYFTRIWIKDKTIADWFVKETANSQYKVANELLNFTEEDWQIASKFYNTVDFNDIYKYGEPEDWNVKIEVDLSSNDYDKYLLHALSQIPDLEPGNYATEGDGIIKNVNVKQLVCTSDDLLVANNPPFDMSLLTIE